MISIQVQHGENVFDAVARGLNTRMDYRLENPWTFPIYRPDVFGDGPNANEDTEPVATVSCPRWTYNVYRRAS